MGKHFSKAVYFQPTEYNCFNQGKEFMTAKERTRFSTVAKEDAKRRKGIISRIMDKIDALKNND